MPNDVYDDQIDYLVDHAKDIYEHWDCATPLFACISPDSNRMYRRYGSNMYRVFGCVTEIKRGSHVAFTEDLTDEMRADKTIPADEHLLAKRFKKMNKARRRKLLERFAYHQRLADDRYNRKPPKNFMP